LSDDATVKANELLTDNFSVDPPGAGDTLH